MHLKPILRAVSLLTAFASLNTLAQPCTGDLNSDGTVDLVDIRILGAAIWTQIPSPAFDMDQNGRLDILDPIRVVNAQGPCGTLYYVCDCQTGADPDCVPGNDVNDGLTPQTAWRSYDRAQDQWAQLQAGDGICFAQGGAFSVEGSVRWVNQNSTRMRPCTVRDYQPSWGSGDEARPIIWQHNPNHAFEFANGGMAVPQEGYRISNLDLRCDAPDPSNAWAFFFYNDIDVVTIDNVAADGFGIGVHVGGSNPCGPDPNCDGRNDEIIVKNSTITNNRHQGWLGAGDGCRIENSLFDGNGSDPIFDHNIYIAGSSQGMFVTGNTLYRSTIDGSGNCTAVSLVAHGHHDQLTIDGNLVFEDIGGAGPGCWGIAIDPGYSSSESFTNVVIRGNRVINVGNLGIGTASCQNCRIENNVVIQEQSGGFTAIAAPNRARGGNDLPMSDIQIANNSIYVMSAGGTGILLGDEGANHVLVSNAVHFDGNAAFNAFDLNLPASNYTAVDHNTCFFPNNPNATWEASSGTNPNALAAWQVLSGFDLNSQLAAPGFASPQSPDHDLRPLNAAANIVDVGHPTLSTTNDLTGTARDLNPDAGAYEWIPLNAVNQRD